MQSGICLLSVIGARKEASGASEMVTQLLFGDHYTITEQKDGWLKIITAQDRYECWISAKQHTKINQSTFDRLQKEPAVYCNDYFSTITNKQTGISFPITLGARLPFLQNNQCAIENNTFEYNGAHTNQNATPVAKTILSTAHLFINAPYLWGGKSPLGIDCSGFTQNVFKVNGYLLPRDAYQQVEKGTPLSFVEEAEAGDLAFFDNEEGRITHVGILLNNQEIIHASGMVKIEKFDHYGIYNSQNRGYSHTLRVIKRVL